tara:strand:+ start:104 stop:865 length:762 start_codon:yes stop_codon:yes gene_type:complete
MPWQKICCSDQCRVENRKANRRKRYAENSKKTLAKNKEYMAKRESQKPMGASCNHCGEWFDYSMCRTAYAGVMRVKRMQRYCSRKCNVAEQRAKYLRSAGELVDMPCKQCGDPIRVTQRHADHVATNNKSTLRKYCSDDCLKEALRLNVHERLANRVRNVVRKALMYAKKSAKSEALTGCSFSFLREHIESQFTNGMSWDKFLNAGKLGIHIDHIKPISSFDLTKPSEQKKCFHFSNLQPLWAIDNIRKGAKL